jgi:AAA ATPase domain
VPPPWDRTIKAPTLETVDRAPRFCRSEPRPQRWFRAGASVFSRHSQSAAPDDARASERPTRTRPLRQGIAVVRAPPGATLADRPEQASAEGRSRRSHPARPGRLDGGQLAHPLDDLRARASGRARTTAIPDQCRREADASSSSRAGVWSDLPCALACPQKSSSDGPGSARCSYARAGAGLATRVASSGRRCRWPRCRQGLGEVPRGAVCDSFIAEWCWRDARACDGRRRAPVGRGAELVVLDRALGAVDAGGSRALGLWGEPGIGKSRLLGELGSRALARGHLVLAGRAAELERDVPFGLWVDALDSPVGALWGRGGGGDGGGPAGRAAAR